MRSYPIASIFILLVLIAYKLKDASKSQGVLPLLFQKFPLLFQRVLFTKVLGQELVSSVEILEKYLNL